MGPENAAELILRQDNAAAGIMPSPGDCNWQACWYLASRTLYVETVANKFGGYYSYCNQKIDDIIKKTILVPLFYTTHCGDKLLLQPWLQIHSNISKLHTHL